MGIRGYAAGNPVCREQRESCAAFRKGNCIALSDTKFKRPCPFYYPRNVKSKEMSKKQEARNNGKD